MTARILIVEDDPLSQDLIRTALAGRGYIVDAAADSFAGVRLARDHRYDLALVDYHLPGLDGYASARLMRDLGGEEGGAPRLVALTADRQGLAARQGAQDLFDAILAKPIRPADLFAFVAGLLEAGPETAQAAAQAFLEDPRQERARAAAEVFWRSRGLTGCPRIAPLPPPGSDQAAALGLCFEVVDVEAADLVVLLDAAGLDALHELRTDPAAPVLPAVDMAGLDGEACDARFRINDPASWSRLAEVAQGFAARRAALRGPSGGKAVEDRLLAYLFASGRKLRIAPLPSRPPVAGGFREAWARREAARLQALGLLAPEPEEADAAQGRLAYGLTPAAIAVLTGAGPSTPCDALPSAQPGPDERAAASLTTLRRRLVEGLSLAAQAPAARILLVEDLAINREIARAMLEAAGHLVEVVRDGAEAVAAVQRTPYDLVLMDVQMPGMDGITATRRIRALGGTVGDLPILGMTANTLPEHLEALIVAGMDDAIGKPFQRDDLAAAVERWRRARRPEEPSAELDRAVFDELVELIGRDQVGRLLDQLAARLQRSFDAPAEDRARLGRDAHAMVSSAGMIGFKAISDACRHLEAACSGDGPAPVEGILVRVQALKAATLKEVAALRRGAGPGEGP